jgi:uncharacterized protein YkwD
MLIRHNRLASFLVLSLVSLAGTLCSAADDPHVVLSADEAELLRRVNAERAKVGAAPLEAQPQLMLAARSHSANLLQVGYVSHTVGGTMTERIKRQGLDKYGRSGEIVAGAKTPEAAVTAWMGSDGHRANMLNAGYTRVGLGVSEANSRGTRYWTCLFITVTDPVGARGTVEIPGQAKSPEATPDQSAVPPKVQIVGSSLGITNATSVVLKVYKLGGGTPELIGTLQSWERSSFLLPVGTEISINRTDTRSKVQSATVGEANVNLEIRF